MSTRVIEENVHRSPHRLASSVRRGLASLALGATTAACAILVAGCGGAGRTSTATSTTSTPRSTAADTTAVAPAAVDRDRDGDTHAAQDDTRHPLLAGAHSPTTGERRAIADLITGYYRAGLAGDGAKGCSMLYSTLAEATPEDYGQSPPGPPYLHGTTCPAVITALFKHSHSLFAAEVPHLRVARIALVERHGVALLDFGHSLPEREIAFQREGRAWKLRTLLDDELP